MSPFLFIKHKFLRTTVVAGIASDDGVESIFSEPEWNLYSKKNRSNKLPPRERWEALRSHFIKRDVLLERLTRTKKPAFRRQLMQREQIVRQRAVERLLSKCTDEKIRNQLESEVAESYQFQKAENDSSSNLLSRTWDVLTFEMNSSVPAVLALLLHTFTHSGIDGGVGFLADEFAQWTQISWRTKQVIALLLGLFLLRSTGDLFWWARDPIYEMVKFDYHNRKSLRYRDAQWIWNIRKRKALRATLFMIGFYLMYGASTSYFLSWHRNLFDERSSILDRMPSTNFLNQNGICPAVLEESFCSDKCQNEVEWHEETDSLWTQKDLNWTWSILTIDSYENYWTEWMHGGGDGALHSIPYLLMFYSGFAILGIILLRISGLRMEDKY